MAKLGLFILGVIGLIAITILGIMGLANFGTWSLPFTFIIAFLLVDTVLHFYRKFDQ
jgi:hypothetical protein